MNNLFKLSLLLCITVWGVACLNTNQKEELGDDDFQLVEINELYSMKVPKYMKKVQNLNDEASLQYQNIFRETYLIVIDESLDEFVSVMQELGEYNDSISVIENYRQMQLEFLHENIAVTDENTTQSIFIHDMKAEVVELDSKLDGYNIAHFLAFVEGGENLYTIMAWTLQDRKEKYAPTFRKTIQSFKLLHRAD